MKSNLIVMSVTLRKIILLKEWDLTFDHIDLRSTKTKAMFDRAKWRHWKYVMRDGSLTIVPAKISLESFT
jgi:hypothetical protein